MDNPGILKPNTNIMKNPRIRPTADTTRGDTANPIATFILARCSIGVPLRIRPPQIKRNVEGTDRNKAEPKMIAGRSQAL